MQERTKYLRLPFQFDTESLIRDLSLILDGKWTAHFNTQGYTGNWKVISLYAKQGDDSNIFAFPNADSVMSETPILKKSAYFKKVIDSFKCPILTARILRLDTGAEIKPHRDYKLGYEDGNFRLHIPITTNEDIQFILDDDKIRMLPGECWYTNVNYVHSVKNSGKTDRVHLVIDGERNDWSDQLFFSLAPKETFQAIPKEKDSPETMKRMIEELEQSHAPIATQLIEELTEKLNNLDKKTNRS